MLPAQDSAYIYIINYTAKVKAMVARDILFQNIAFQIIALQNIAFQNIEVRLTRPTSAHSYKQQYIPATGWSVSDIIHA